MNKVILKASVFFQVAAALSLVAAALLGHFLAGSQSRRPDRELRRLSGCPVRVVWCQDLGDGQNLYAEGRNLRLMGFDSEDGLGERPILSRPWSYARPMITPRGDRVLFSSRADDTVYIVNWDGSGLRGLVEGFGLDVWRDPSDGREWLYYATDARPTRRQDERKYTSVVRCPIDEPNRVELVWNLLPITQLSENNFQISGDGRRASQHGPDICVVNELPNVKWTPYGKGCWPSIAPDNSYRFWHFDGNHRTLSLFDPGPANHRTIPLNIAPDLEGREVFHPRWSNHPRFLAWTGPKLSREGGPAMEIYVGRFNESFTTVEKCVRVSYNRFADICPDVWVASAAETNWPPPTVSDADAPIPTGLDWPSDRREIVYIWRNRSAANESKDPDSGEPRVCRVIPRGRARFGRHFEMLTHGGWFEADGLPENIFARISKSQQLALELVCSDESPPDVSASVIGLLNADGATNLALRVRGGRLWLLLRRGNETQEFDLAAAPRKPTHVGVSFDAESLVAFVGGLRVLAIPLTPTELEWNGDRILFGDLSGAWRGRLDHIAMYGRRVFKPEFEANAEILTRQLAARRPASRVVVRARLVEASHIPTPESISPYRSAMVAHAYDVVDVLQGELPNRAILAARWAILDLEIQADAARTVGEVYRLELERFDEHPELEGERLVMDLEDVSRPLYYEVDL